MVCILSVAIEVEELSIDELHIRSRDSINLLGILSGQLEYLSSLVDVQRGIGTVPLKIGLSYCCIRQMQHRTLWTRRGEAELAKNLGGFVPFLECSVLCSHVEEYLLSVIAWQITIIQLILKYMKCFRCIVCALPQQNGSESQRKINTFSRTTYSTFDPNRMDHHIHL